MLKLNRNIKKHLIYLLICVAPFSLMGMDCKMADDKSFYNLHVFSTVAGFTGVYIIDGERWVTFEDDTTELSYFIKSIDLGSFETLRVSVAGKVGASTLKAFLYRDNEEVVFESDRSVDNSTVSVDFLYEPGTTDTTE